MDAGHIAAADETMATTFRWTHMKSISGAEQNVNRCLPSDLGNKVRPASGKWAVSKRYPMPMRAKYAEIVAPLYLEHDIEHIWSGWDQLDINFKSAVLDRALHDNLRYLEGA